MRPPLKRISVYMPCTTSTRRISSLAPWNLAKSRMKFMTRRADRRWAPSCLLAGHGRTNLSPSRNRAVSETFRTAWDPMAPAGSGKNTPGLTIEMNSVPSGMRSMSDGGSFGHLWTKPGAGSWSGYRRRKAALIHWAGWMSSGPLLRTLFARQQAIRGVRVGSGRESDRR